MVSCLSILFTTHVRLETPLHISHMHSSSGVLKKPKYTNLLILLRVDTCINEMGKFPLHTHSQSWGMYFNFSYTPESIECVELSSDRWVFINISCNSASNNYWLLYCVGSIIEGHNLFINCLLPVTAQHVYNGMWAGSFNWSGSTKFNISAPINSFSADLSSLCAIQLASKKSSPSI